MDAMKSLLLSAALLLAAVTAANAQPGTSAFTTRLDDPRAVQLSGAVGDGKADDSAAIQAAIDKAGSDREEGIVFIPARPLPHHSHHLCVAGGAGDRLGRRGGRCSCWAITRRALPRASAAMVIFAGFRAGRQRQFAARASRFPRALPAAGQRAAQLEDRRRQSRHLLFGDEQHRFRDRQGQ